MVVVEHGPIVIGRTGRRQAWFRTLRRVLFAQAFWPGIQDGTITVTFRRWKRRQVVAGNRYRTPAGILQVESVDVVDPAAIGDADARRSGYASAALLVADLRGNATLPLYRVAFHRVDAADPRDVLASTATLSDADVATIDSRLERMDRSSSHGPWTAAVLDVIAEHPGQRAADLAAMFERETQPFKADVRKLKNLGLTLSLEVGYRLSPRGVAYRAATRRPR
jgi:hypothetical protein